MAVASPATRRMGMVGFVPRRTVIAALALVLIVVAWQAYGLIMAPSKLPTDLQASLAAGQQSSYDLVVRLPFTPRQFHIKLFQSYGRLAGVDGTAVYIRDVPAEKVPEIARYYWVERVDLGTRG